MDAVIARAVDGTEHPNGVISGLLEPQANHLPGVGLLFPEADQDQNALSPELMSGVGVNRRATSRSVSF
jgi:hypothetical protein